MDPATVDAPGPDEHDHDHAVVRSRPGRDGQLLTRSTDAGMGNRATVHMLSSLGLINEPGDASERHADAVAAGARSGPTPITRTPDPHASAAMAAELAGLGAGVRLPAEVVQTMQPRLGVDLSSVRTHTGGGADGANAAIGADAFTYGNDIYFGAGKSPGLNRLTAHELGHVAQQHASGSASVGPHRIQPSFTGSYVTDNGVFEIDMQTRQGKTDPANPHIGFDGYIRFFPGAGTPNSNEIVMTQIVKLSDLAGADVNPVSLGAAQGQRGAVGQPGLRTQDDVLGGVDGGWFTDVNHQVGGVPLPAGSDKSSTFEFSPAAPGTVGVVGHTAQPAVRGGGVGASQAPEIGFKRSDDPSDIHSAALYDTPGTTDKAGNLRFEFESVARGVDAMFVYASVLWGFEIKDGVVMNEHLATRATASATFAEAQEKHVDTYRHEPVTVYFDFDDDRLRPSEEPKMDTILPYLVRHPLVSMQIEGAADITGGASDYNLDLAMRRADSVRDALLARGIAGARMPITVSTGASTDATANAGTANADGADAAVGADQTREANRAMNRRVVITFEPPPAAPAGGGAP